MRRLSAGSAGPRTSAPRARGRRQQPQQQHQRRSARPAGDSTERTAASSAGASAIQRQRAGRLACRAGPGPGPAAAAWRGSPITGADHAADQARARPRSGRGPASPRTTAPRARALIAASTQRERPCSSRSLPQRRSISASRSHPTTIPSRKGALCRKEKCVRSKWISTSPAPSAPAASAGRNGRIPTARGDADALEDVEDEMHRAVP